MNRTYPHLLHIKSILCIDLLEHIDNIKLLIFKVVNMYYSKIQGAEIFLDDSITQYFNDKIDPTSFLLAWNARWILRDILSNKWIKTPSFSYVEENHPEADIKEMVLNLKKHANFFKHVNKKDWEDENTSILCEEWWLEYILWDALGCFVKITWKPTPLMNIYHAYNMYKGYNKYWDDNQNNKLFSSFKKMTQDLWRVATKWEFYKVYKLNKKEWKL